MPNYCQNRLRVIGNKEVIAQFKNKAIGPEKGRDLSLNNFVPMPKELENTPMPQDTKKAISKKLIKKFGVDNWYDWCLKNWGTKWDIDADLVSEDDDMLEYIFDSAWSPPVKWLEKVAKLYPDLKFNLRYI